MDKKRAEQIRNIEEDEKEGARAMKARVGDRGVGTEDKCAFVDLCRDFESFHGAMTRKIGMKTVE